MRNKFKRYLAVLMSILIIMSGLFPSSSLNGIASFVANAAEDTGVSRMQHNVKREIYTPLYACEIVITNSIYNMHLG